MAVMRSKWVNDNRDETLACQEMEARQEEKKPTSPDRKPEAAQKAEVPAENATVMPVGEPKKKRRRDRKLAAERRRQKPKDLTRENYETQKKLAVARRGTTRREKVTRHTKVTDRKVSRRATVARRRRDICRPNITRRVKVARQTKETGKKMSGRPRIAWRKKSVGRRNRIAAMIERATQRLWPLKKNFTNTAKLEIAKRTVRSTVERRTRKNWTLWRVRPLPKRKNGNGLCGRDR
jgi:hypothetical protein